MNQYPMRFAAAYAAIGAVGLAGIAAFFVIMFTPVTPVAHKADIKNALGVTTQKGLVKEAEQYIASQAAQAGVTLLSQKLTSVKQTGPSTVVVTMSVKTAELGVSTFRISFHKGIYSLTGASAA